MAVSARAGSIDDFRLRGSPPCRRMGDTATTQRCAGRWCTILTITNLHYQRAKPSPLWCRLCLETRIGRGLAWIPQILWGKAQCGAGPACPRLARRVGGAAREGEMVEGAPPPFLAAGAARARGSWCAPKVTPSPLPSGGRSLHSDPCGKAETLKNWTRVVVLNLALIAGGIRASSHPGLPRVRSPCQAWCGQPIPWSR